MKMRLQRRMDDVSTFQSIGGRFRNGSSERRFFSLTRKLWSKWQQQQLWYLRSHINSPIHMRVICLWCVFQCTRIMTDHHSAARPILIWNVAAARPGFGRTTLWTHRTHRHSVPFLHIGKALIDVFSCAVVTVIVTLYLPPTTRTNT